jgi:hypothetical protein
VDGALGSAGAGAGEVVEIAAGIRRTRGCTYQIGASFRAQDPPSSLSGGVRELADLAEVRAQSAESVPALARVDIPCPKT